ncbi:ribosomal protection-like ABC-F family protein [Bacillus massilinigeriensis]|uniref:ribosomal protection-like ABC-F family protein n=1 Tax=Bacillus massilionigeriensis TaxID=1805475 RepID=UPI00096B4E14|nr:ABC-F type ribosomal protection protein [Bacillus massilionigeriensis]
MFILKVDHLKMEYNGTTLFEGASLEIKPKEHVALIGENGVGKTTFLKGILGEAPVVKGEIMYGVQRDEIGWMEQDGINDTNLTTREYVEGNNELNSGLKKKLNQLTKQLTGNGQDEKLINAYNEALQKYLDANGYEWESEVEKVLSKLGIPENLWDTPFVSLSGGQKTRVKLARVIIGSPKLLILDEPTNHLDVETVEWLQEWINRYKGSVLFISHEREFIDKCANVTYELTKSGTNKYIGGYSFYKEQKEHEIKTKQYLYEKQEQERKKLLEAIQTYKDWHQQAKATASVRNPYAQKQAAKQAVKYKVKEKALERLEKERIEKPKEPSVIHASFETQEFSSKKMLSLTDVDFSYGNHPVIQKVTLEINRGDRVAVVGKNGSGKTTLLKLMTGGLAPLSGSIARNPQLKIGYFFQELESLNEENTILDELLSIPNMKQSDARTILACFLFHKEEVFKKINQLSMGEKCRVAFVKLYFSEANLLVLDEPTNYLDIPTRERIEDALNSYPGSVVIVSHDPYLLRKIANKVVHVENKVVSTFFGGYEEWEQHSDISSQNQSLMNELQLLDLELLDLLSKETNEIEEEERGRLEKVRQLKGEIDYIKQLIEKNS